jgi:hypothetical protein
MKCVLTNIQCLKSFFMEVIPLKESMGVLKENDELKFV